MKKSMLTLALVVGTAGAFAQTPPTTADAPAGKGDRMAAHFAERDGNHDGRISLAEWQRAEQVRQKAMFERLDGNHDGAVTQDEMRQAHEQRREDRQQRRDKRREHMDHLRALDADHDQALTRAELGDKMPRLGENFDRLDGNHDGKLTREEIREGRKALAPAATGKP